MHPSETYIVPGACVFTTKCEMVFLLPGSCYPIKTWVKQLQAKEDPGQRSLAAVRQQLNEGDSTTALEIFSELTKISPSSNHYFNARTLSLTASDYYNKLPQRVSQAGAFFTKALNEAYLTADEELRS